MASRWAAGQRAGKKGVLTKRVFKLGGTAIAALVLGYLVLRPPVCTDLQLLLDGTSGCKGAWYTETPVRLEVEVPSDVYWTAELETMDGRLRIPVYASHSKKRSGWMIAPEPGSYRLTVRTPQEVASVNTDEEPPFCLVTRLAVKDVEERIRGTSTGARIMDFCGRRLGVKWDWDPALLEGEGREPLHSLTRNSSLLYSRELTFVPRRTKPQWMDILAPLAVDYLGPAAHLFPAGGKASYGFWRRDNESSSIAGSTHFHPNPDLKICPTNPKVSSCLSDAHRMLICFSELVRWAQVPLGAVRHGACQLAALPSRSALLRCC